MKVTRQPKGKWVEFPSTGSCRVIELKLRQHDPKGTVMLTVGQLVQRLSELDPALPVGAIDVDRLPGSQRLNVATRDVVDVDTAHHPTTGQPLVAWLTCRTPIAAFSPLSLPKVVVQMDPCGCLVAVDADSTRSINLDAVGCAHHQPDAPHDHAARR
jgi:hypothetical protein